MPLKKFSNLFFGALWLMWSVSASASEISLKDWNELSDQKVSALGKIAFSFEKESWKHAETEHFILHFRDEKKSETAVIYSEHYYEWIKKFFEIKKEDWSHKNHIFVFDEEGLWKDFLAKANPFSFEAGGFTNGHELFMFRPAFWLSPQQVLAHEMSHIILFRFLEGTPPLYLHEGFAEYVSTRAISTQFGGDEYAVRTLELLSKDQYVPLEEFTQIASYPSKDTDAFYRQSELLVRYLITQYGNKKLFQFLKETSAGNAFENSLQKVYGMDLKELEEKFISFAVSKK